MEKLLLIDGNSLINRAFYAMPFFTNKKGQHTGAVFGFANMLMKAIEKVEPQYVVVAFDVSRKTFRTELYPDYKGTRGETPDELRSQFDVVKQMLDYMKIARVEQQGIEADDIIGTLSKKFNGKTYILTGDRDVLQLLDKNISVIFTKKGISELEEYTDVNLKSKYGVNPNQVVELKALTGDKSDNIPGVSGVGPVTAIKWLEKYDNVDTLLENIDEIKGRFNQLLKDNLEMIKLSKELATIKTDCQLDLSFENAKLCMPFEKQLKVYFEELEFETFLKRKNLFKEEVFEKIQTKEIKNLDDVDQIVNGAKSTKKFAFCLNGEISFAYDNINYVLAKQLDLFSNVVSAWDCLSKLKPLFEDDNICKITCDLKSELDVLYKNNINISKTNIYDCCIMHYLISAGQGGSYTSCDAGNLLIQYQKYLNDLDNLDLHSLYDNIELPLTFVLYNMEKHGFKIDVDQLNVLKQNIENKIANLKKQIYELAGFEFNINSPKQVGDVLYDKLGLTSYLEKKRSTGIEVLNDMAHKHPIVPLIINYRKTYKLYSTYILPYCEITQKQGNVIKTVFNQTLTATGRLSSSEPNLQNIPVRTEEGKDLRKIFVSSFKDGVLMSADYNQIELRLLAHLSNDENLIYCFNNNVDVHTKTASEIFNVDVNQVTDIMRRSAKAVNFGIVYGISDYGLATNLLIPVKQAKQYIEMYLQSYPNVKKYQQDNIQLAKQTGMVKTMFGRIRRIPEINSSNYVLRQFGERVAINMPLQGSASDIIKLAMIKVEQKLKENNLKTKLVLQIHDELVLDVPKEEITICKNILTQCMESVINLRVKLPVGINYAYSLYDC